MIRSLAALALSFLVSGVSAQEKATSVTLRLHASFEHGKPAPAVRFKLPDGVRETDERGRVEYSGPLREADVDAMAADDRYWLLPVDDTTRSGTRTIYIRAFAKDIATLDEAAREDFLYYRKQIARLEAKALFSEGKLETAPPTIPIAALLAGDRVESDEADPNYDDATTTGSATVAARLLDPRGNAIAGALLYIFQFDPDTNTVKLLTSERTSATGDAVFTGIAPLRWVRVETEPNRERFARSSLVRPKPDERLVLAPMVSHPADRVLSGVVVREGQPLPGVVVRSVRNGNRGPELSTLTDANGYFMLAPLPPGETQLRFSVEGPQGREEYVGEMATGVGELLWALELLEKR